MRRHAADVVSLVFGIIFAGLTLVWAAAGSGVVDHGQVWWIGPLVLVVAGAVGAVTAVRRSTQPEQAEQPES